jgi:hypothetical protein
MLNGKIPIYLTLIAAAVFSATMLAFEPYSYRSGSASPWAAYADPAQRFLSAALKKDSLALVEQSASATPVAWGLRVARQHPDSLAAWSEKVHVWSGFTRGDTAEVLVYPDSDVCSEQPVWMRFVGKVDKARVVEAGSACFEPRRERNEAVIPDVAKGLSDSR